MTYSLAVQAFTSAALTLPSSKSMSNRALLLAALCTQHTEILNRSDCDDTTVLHTALRTLPATIDIHAAGTAMRFLTAFLSTRQGEEHLLTGTARMQQRPIGILVSALRQLGADISYVGAEGYPPLRIRGRHLDGGSVTMMGDVSSQYISALLMIGPTLRQGLTIHLRAPIVSRPYIDLTLSMMAAQGAVAGWSDTTTLTVQPIPYRPTPYIIIEGDWSAAAFWYETLALSTAVGGEVRLCPLSLPSVQGDAVVADIFAPLGITTSVLPATDAAPRGVVLRRTKTATSSVSLSCDTCPDLVPALACACCGMGIPFSLTGVQTLKIKESDRLAALETELRKVGFVLHTLDGSRLVWQGECCEATHEPLDPHDDHRLAMALAPLSFVRNGIQIMQPDVVNKSYPTFWQHLQQVGIALTAQP